MHVILLKQKYFIFNFSVYSVRSTSTTFLRKLDTYIISTNIFFCQFHLKCFPLHLWNGFSGVVFLQLTRTSCDSRVLNICWILSLAGFPSSVIAERLENNITIYLTGCRQNIVKTKYNIQTHHAKVNIY